MPPSAGLSPQRQYLNTCDGTSIGARLLTPDQLQHEIAADLKHCCLVVEIAVYPSKNKPIAILPEEFSLRIAGTDKTIKPASSRLVASILHYSGGGGNDKAPAPSDQDRMAMELELSSKSLPEGSTTVPVAGYLYFPLSAKKQKNKTGYQLENTLTGQKLTLTLSPP